MLLYLTPGKFLKIILVILLSSVKFIAGPPFAFAFNKQYDFTFVGSVSYSILGGMLGVVVFTFFSEQVIRLWHWLKEKAKKVFKKKAVFSEPTVDIDKPVEVHYLYTEKNAATKKVFSKRNRRAIKIWNSYGLMGIAFLTPVILSIPIGTIIANNMVHNKKKIFLYMFVSIVFWSLMLNLIFEIYHIKRNGWL